MLEPLLGKLNNMRVILATSSKQRQDLLRTTRLKFEICVSDFEENLRREDYSFSEYVQETALNKVNDVYGKLQGDARPPDLIIGLDTMVVFDGKMYGKPNSKKDAADTIRTLTASGLPHFVYTGVVVRFRNEIVKFTEATTVYMQKLTEEEILSYVNTEEPMGKAGSYAIQGIASSFVRRIDGDYNNVIGLPVCKLAGVLKNLVQ